MPITLACSLWHATSLDTHQFAVLTLSDEDIKEIRARHARVLHTCEHDPSLYQHSYWDYALVTVSTTTYDDLNDLLYESPEWVVVPDAFDPTEAIGEDHTQCIQEDRTEAQVQHVNKDGVYWAGNAKHVDVHIETRPLHIAWLDRALAGEIEAWAPEKTA